MLNLLLLLVPLAAPQGDWTAIPLPSFCDEQGQGAYIPPLLDGHHLHIDEEFASRDGGSTPNVALQASDVSALLRAGASAAGTTIDIFPYAPPLLVRGTPEDLSWAKAQVEGLQRAGKRSELIVGATLTSDHAETSAPVPEGTLSDLLGPVKTWKGTVTSGDEIVFGTSRRTRFLGDYDIEVATDSGVAAPIIGSAYTGATLHLTVCRVDEGRSVHVRGLLDLAELERVETFEPGTPDVGDFQQPIVHSVSLAFSGVTELGGELVVRLEGTPLHAAGWNLTVAITGTAEPTSLAENDWRIIDVALLSGRGRLLPSFDPGAALDDQLALDALGPLAGPLSASGIAGSVETRPRGGRSLAGAQRSPQHVGESLILISSGRAKDDGHEALSAFVHALEAPRLETAIVELTRGDFRAVFPVAGGEATRLLVGTERTVLTSYRAEIAPNTWMPRPIVEKLFDGLAWQGRLSDGTVAATAWTSETHSIEVQTREETRLGAIQLANRSIAGARWKRSVGDDSPLKGAESAPRSPLQGVEMTISRP
jgi:hypothetical protein